MTGNLHLIRRAISVSWTHSDRMPSWSGPGPPSRRIIQSISIDPPNRWVPHWTHCTTSMNRHCEIRECSRNYKQTCSHWLHFAKLHLKKVTFCKKSASHWPQESMFKHVGNHLIFIKSLKNEKSQKSINGRSRNQARAQIENAQSDRIKQSLKRYYPSKSSYFQIHKLWSVRQNTHWHLHCHSLWYTLPGTSAP